MSRIILVFFTIVFFCVGSFSNASSGKGDINIKFRGQILSAEFIKVSLRLILEKLNRERGIWFQGSDSVLDTEVSVRFKNLSVEKGIKRILSRVNYALFFDQNERLLGLFVVDKGVSISSLPKTENIAVWGKKLSASEPNAGPDPTIKGILVSGHKAIDGDIVERETHALQSQEFVQKNSAINKLNPSSGDGDEFAPKKGLLLPKPWEKATDAANLLVKD